MQGMMIRTRHCARESVHGANVAVVTRDSMGAYEIARWLKDIVESMDAVIVR